MVCDTELKDTQRGSHEVIVCIMKIRVHTGSEHAYFQLENGEKEEEEEIP